MRLGGCPVPNDEKSSGKGFTDNKALTSQTPLAVWSFA
jgi:hypothetical protein